MKTLHLSIIIGIGMTMIVIGNSNLSFAQEVIDFCGACKTFHIPDSPLQQLKSGIPISNIQCAQDLSLVIKAEDGTPACIKQESISKLILRGWIGTTSSLDQNNSIFGDFYQGIENDSGIISIKNQTYYMMTATNTTYPVSSGMIVKFHQVSFSFPYGAWATPGGVIIPFDMTFPDGITETYGKVTKNPDGSGSGSGIGLGPGPSSNRTVTVQSVHTHPQAGVTMTEDQIKLLVSTDVNSTVLQTIPKLTYMNIKVFSSYTPSSLADHFLAGSLNSTEGPIQNGNVTITVNGIVMGTTGTYPNGCFQFNNWNDSKFADQINKSISLGSSSIELNFQAQYFGDSNHSPANASAISYLSLYAVPLAPAQYDTGVYPSDQINVTQGNSTQFHLTVKPFSKYWEVEHMKLNLQRTPCGLSYHLSPIGNNDSVLVNNTASFDVILNTTSYTPSGRYWISIDQDLSDINQPNIGANVGAFYLNVLKK